METVLFNGTEATTRHVGGQLRKSFCIGLRLGDTEQRTVQSQKSSSLDAFLVLPRDNSSRSRLSSGFAHVLVSN